MQSAEVLDAAGVRHGWIAEYNAQGMESEFWRIFQDRAFAESETAGWDFQGMVILGDGHELTILGEDGEALWSGILRSRRVGRRRLTPQAPDWSPPDVPIETWNDWFQRHPPLAATLRDYAQGQADAAAFDAFAPEYDLAFTGTMLGRMLRRRVWAVLAQQFQTGQHVLELTCGTGEDAVWLAQRGMRVVATDGSPEMLGVANRKSQAAGVADKIIFTQLDIASPDLISDLRSLTPQFDGVLSNFGGLNVISDWRPLAEGLAEVVKPGGRVVLVPMGPVCPWETAWHVAHADLHTAARRWRGPATAIIGDARMRIFYPSARRLRHDFSPWFRHLHSESLGLWLPPSYLGHLVDLWPRLFAWLDRLEARTARLSGGWGDHFISVFERLA